ncbi:MAG: glycolate oxidase subunit GlcE [Betaproteobacteria bacterium]
MSTGNSAEELQERVRAAAAARAPLRPRGGGSKDFYGNEPRGDVLDTRGHAGIVSYEPTELVVTARCGTPLADLEAELARQGQMLAFEPPRFSPRATLGGCVAAGLSGPRRAAAGAVRDFVLGARMVDGAGRDLSFGGQVMKNVAGYDVSRLLAGSLGTLGVILEVSLKVLPLPAAERTLRLEKDETGALDSVNRWAGQPLPVSATSWSGGALTVRLSGAETAVKAAAARIGGDALDPAQAATFWEGVREHSDPFFGDATPLWRLSLPSTAPAVPLPGRQMAEWSGALRWWKTDAPAADVRAVAEKSGGHATLFRGGDRSTGAFHPLSPALAKLHRGLKAAFDPSGIFSPGRMYADL